MLLGHFLKRPLDGQLSEFFCGVCVLNEGDQAVRRFTVSLIINRRLLIVAI